MKDNEARILIVEDEVASLNLLASYFEAEDYVVHKARDSEEAEKVLATHDIEVALIDIKLPGKDGLLLTREIRNKSDMGIILVTHKKEEIDRIIGLEIGADDYVTKPYNTRELFVRVKNLLQRVKANTSSGTDRLSDFSSIKFGDWILDTGRRLLKAEDGSSIKLTEGEYKLLSTLIDHAGVTLSRDQIMNAMKRREWYPTDRTIDVMITRLRKKLGDSLDEPRYISTAHGTGYIFVAKVSGE